ncbi:MAG TPA: DJ-1/PfpI family protein [Rhizomicrobium sp.]|jgi:transcriptional regulator GlxA family with amidase domain|nr:DJ-1/PfpI family protein [Rhizomicrobium sp.]
MARQICILGYEGVTALDLIGPAETFATANSYAENAYEITIAAVDGQGVRTESGLQILSITKCPAGPFDTIIIPGGEGLRIPKTAAAVAVWIKNEGAKARRIVSVCTGIYGLARTGLLDGRRATTHWRFIADVRREFPDIKLEPDAIFIQDGRFHTSAGITAGIDLSLALIEKDLGPKVSLAVARELVVYIKRPGGQLQYSEPLQFQTRATDKFADLAAWIPTHLKANLSVDAMARRTHLSRRHFTRLFKQTFGIAPGDYVETVRLDEVTRRLALAGQTVESVAGSIGYASREVFRNAFERRYGIAPSSYRQRFSSRVRT